MSTPRGWSSGWPSGQQLRIGDVEREAAARALGEHFAAGRLTKEEFDERADRAWSARTAADLRPLFADLPAPHPGTRPGTAGVAASPRTSRPARPRMPVVPVFLLAFGLVMLLHAPGAVLLLLLGVWWLTASMRWRRHRAHWSAHYQHWGARRF